MASTGLFRTAVAGIRTRAGVRPTARPHLPRSSFSDRVSAHSHRGLVSSAAPLSASPSQLPRSSPDAVGSSVDSTTTASQVVTESELVSGGFEFLQPYVPTIHNLADTLHLSGPYAHALSIFILAFAVRTVVTLPVTLWQRSKTRKLTEHVLPEWEVMKEQIPLKVRARSRRAGLSYEAFEKEAQKEVSIPDLVSTKLRSRLSDTILIFHYATCRVCQLKTELAKLLRKHNASPLPAFIGPATVSIPVFLLMTALLRQSALEPASPFSSELLPWWSPSPELVQQFKSSTAILADRGFDEAAIAKLKGTMGGPTLVDKDSTMIGPVSFGMLTLANTELNSWSRSSIAKIREVTSGETDAADRTAGKLLANDGKAKGEEVEDEPRRVRIITNALRVLAIAFIPIACQAPGVLVIYWLSSGIYTLVQNSVLAVMDRRSEVINIARKRQLLQEQQRR
ncbi:related to COX18 - mitochondrial inner membrane protein required for membrane insertion of C-terminus of Cox2p [Melanopsichium pennsylvanicum]|uniref:Related to COX18 - mitochondrial inner membrane protein required for membrane insertion of C-terminus of Cox2p n=1 Tax=Melanopsichium pennsylvanicum TaxID=63383 RepID=A0AAJ5C368_9BASI|nr:related to COX18 - mitochondrial inner membrane protein required for membrane insertion of C-terminus of Cox2p [Melanopsichium pennsylvanicum]